VKNLAIARRYAKALLLIGKEHDQAEAYREELAGVARLVSSENTLEQAINNPLYDAEQRKKVLELVIDKFGTSEVMRSFLLLLFDKGRFSLLDQIDTFYQQLADHLKGVARATLVSAATLSDEAVDKIRATLSQRTGKDIILEVQEDPELIGGIVTKIGDLVLDGSIRTQLENMRETLKRGESV
jgi:F-type H+-transporting ATPase subunit delta